VTYNEKIKRGIQKWDLNINLNETEHPCVVDEAGDSDTGVRFIRNMSTLNT
jgi:hypothetical protein